MTWRRVWRLAVLTLVASVVAAARPASAQNLISPTDLSRLATQIVRHADRSRAIRIGVTPVGDTSPDANAPFLAATREQLIHALRAAAYVVERPIQIVRNADVDTGLRDAGWTGSVAPDERAAIEAGAATKADWVVIASIKPWTRVSVLLSVQVLEVTTGRTLDRVSADLPVATAGETRSEPAPLVQEGASIALHPSWSPRRTLIVAGIGASAASGVAAWSHERRLKVMKTEIQALPPGSRDEWDRQVAEAGKIGRDRDFWGAVSIGVGGVTLLYALTSKSPSGRASPERRWTFGLHATKPGVSATWSF